MPAIPDTQRAQEAGLALSRRGFLTAAGSSLAVLAMGSSEGWAQAAGPRRPNLVVILADDLGYGELGVQGCRDIPTPHIDSIAAGGVRFTDGYVTHPVCAPTRAGFLTGRYQQRFGFEFNPGPEGQASDSFGVPLSERLLPERLRQAGYATGLVGKWHLGFRPELTPTQRGFGEFFGFLGGAHPYLPGRAPRGGDILRGSEPVDEKDYLTDAFAREVVAFIDRHRAEPFFLYLALNAVHGPLESIAKYLDRFPHISDPKRKTFAAMCAAMDDAVGAVLTALRTHGLADNTLVAFFSDNGGPTAQTSSGNGPLRGFKGQVYEGGVRVPFMMQWPGHLPAGSVYRQPVVSLDVHATALAAAGVALPQDAPLDGVDLLPFLTGANTAPPHDRLCWRAGEQGAIRMGDWKLVRGARGGGSAWELYNLAEDIGEATDRAAAGPEKVKELQAAWEAWNAQLAVPKWGRSERARTAASRAAGDTARGGESTGRFRQLDRNGDGKLTADELSRPRLFRRLDRNGDGAVTLEEARSARNL